MLSQDLCQTLVCDGEFVARFARAGFSIVRNVDTVSSSLLTVVASHHGHLAAYAAALFVLFCCDVEAEI